MRQLEVVLTLSVIVTLVGCDQRRMATDKVRSGASTRQENDPAKAMIAAKERSPVKVATQGGKPALPPNFPRDVPLYPGATIEKSLSVGEMTNVILVTANPVETVAKFYKDALKSGGWHFKKEGEVESPENTLYSTSRDGDRRSCAVGVHSELGKTHISITLTQKDR